MLQGTAPPPCLPLHHTPFCQSVNRSLARCVHTEQHSRAPTSILHVNVIQEGNVSCPLKGGGLLGTAAKGPVFIPSLQISGAAWINPCCLGHRAGEVSCVRQAAVHPLADILSCDVTEAKVVQGSFAAEEAILHGAFPLFFFLLILLTSLKENKKG